MIAKNERDNETNIEDQSPEIGDMKDNLEQTPNAYEEMTHSWEGGTKWNLVP